MPSLYGGTALSSWKTVDVCQGLAKLVLLAHGTLSPLAKGLGNNVSHQVCVLCAEAPSV